jgi:hypothetical protein
MHNNSTRKEGKYISTAKQKRDNDINNDTKGTCTLVDQREEKHIHISRSSRRGTQVHYNTPNIRKMHTHLQVGDERDTCIPAG